MIFLGNGIGYFIAYLWSAARFRQIRVVTPMDGVRDRFGKANEQFFTWIWLPIGTLYAGIWLNAVSKFCLGGVSAWNAGHHHRDRRRGGGVRAGHRRLLGHRGV